MASKNQNNGIVKKRLYLIVEILKALYGTPDLGNVSDPLEELIYLTITQRTRIKTAFTVYHELRRRFRRLEDVLNAPDEELREILSIGGRGNLKARAVKEILSTVWEREGKLSLDRLRNLPEQEVYDYLILFPWIGEKIARCVMMYSLGFDTFPADSNCIKVLTRMEILDPIIGSLEGLEHRKAQARIAGCIPLGISRTLHVNMVVHGQEVCRERNPLCRECEIRRWCQHFRKKAAEEHAGRSLTLVDIFSGAGGIAYGFGEEGYRTLLAIDNDGNAHETFLINNPGIEESRIINSNVEKVKNSRVRKLIGDDAVDVLAAGVPCQGFSIVGYRTKPKLREGNGYRAHNDDRNLLFRQVLRFVRLLKPEFILMENVRGVDKIRVKYWRKKDAVIELFRKSIENMGYYASIIKVNAQDFGIPQNRTRIFCVARRAKLLPENVMERLLEAARELGFEDNKENLGNAIADLPALEMKDGKEVYPWGSNGQVEGTYYQSFVRRPTKVLCNYTTRFHNDDDMRIISEIGQGENYTQLVTRAPWVLEGRKMKTYRADNFPDKFYRLRYDSTSRTIVAHLSKDGNSFIHPEQNRSLTVREAARIQAFPDDFIFSGSRTSQFIQVGNAVPPLLAKVFARFFRKMKEESNAKS